jgi:hypothetical protein
VQFTQSRTNLIIRNSVRVSLCPRGFSVPSNFMSPDTSDDAELEHVVKAGEWLSLAWHALQKFGPLTQTALNSC